MNVDTSLRAQRSLIEKSFSQQFGCMPSVIVAAPGRVNLIGEHIDYNDGLVLPLALERYVLIAAGLGADELKPQTITIHSSEVASTKRFSLTEGLLPKTGEWTDYVNGVIQEWIDRGFIIPSLNAVVQSTVPMGGGLSSSAALEVATATLLEWLTKYQCDLTEKALLCQRAEHKFAGVPCGFMDQFSSVFGVEDELMLIDCQTQKVTHVPFDTRDVSILIIHSNVRHELNQGEYASRRVQCHDALQKIGRQTWRNVSQQDIDSASQRLTAVELRRACHVVSEIIRTKKMAEAVRARDWACAGNLMFASHDSLSNNFEVSCAELDLLVSIAREKGGRAGVYGSRMTGAGFGGCTVSLVATDHLRSVAEAMAIQYQQETGIKPYWFTSRPSQGAHVVWDANEVSK